MSKLWYKQPAKEWEEALPLGNGRLGAMVFGGTDWEHIQLNEESMWFGADMERTNPDTKAYLPQIRELLKDGKISAAQSLMGYAMSGCPNSMHQYQTLGDIYFNFDSNMVVNEGIYKPHELSEYEQMNYKRELILNDAVARYEFTYDDSLIKREVFISKPDDCLVIHMSTEGSHKINFSAMLARGKYFDGVRKYHDNGIMLYGNLGRGGLEFAMTLCGKVKNGSLKVIGEYLCVEQADEVWLYFDAETSYRFSEGELNKLFADSKSEKEYKEGIQKLLCNKLDSKMDAVMNKDYETVLNDHISDYQNYFNKVSFELYDEADNESFPTDERLERLRQGKEDVSLQTLLFDFGRYLLISSSREGNLPATLQGIWNKDFMPPWDSKYTININTEMNYWMAESCNLSKCHMPLFDLLKKMQINGRKTAREMYGCRGFVAHHNTNMYGDTAPQDIWYPGTYWVMGAAWMSTHIWTHYQYTKDKEFLEEMFPVMLESALFFVDFLIERNGYMVTSPSVSPENTYILPNGEYGCICEGPTMDSQILRELFADCINAYKELGEKADTTVILDVDNVKELVDTLQMLKDKLQPTRIGSKGQILEWMEEYEEQEPGHRHISHLYGLFPADQITVDGTPELAEAARKTLEYRLSSGGGHTGWSCAWIINHYAKLWDGNKAYENILKMLTNSTYPNMFDKHPPFQIDGNFGVCAGIAQMIVQSNSDRVVLLPALPDKWKKGSVSGLKLVGGAIISLKWDNCELTEVKLDAPEEYSSLIKYKDRTVEAFGGTGILLK